MRVTLPTAVAALLLVIDPAAHPAASQARTAAKPAPTVAPAVAPPVAPAVGDESAVAEAWRRRREAVPVEVTARVVRLLKDDSVGVRHQRFRVQVGTMRTTVMVSHNVKLSGRAPVRVGDVIRLRGVYEWTRKGGVIRWTHRDPRGVHAAGFIRLNARTYE